MVDSFLRRYYKKCKVALYTFLNLGGDVAALKKNRPQSKNKAPMLKMKELSDAAGVPKSTILLYAGQGLLPKPVKTSPIITKIEQIR